MKVCGNIEIAHRWHHMHAFHTLSIHFGRVCMVQLHAKYRQWSATLLPWQTWNTTSFQQWKIGHTAACWLCGCHLEVVGPSHCLNHLPYQLKWIIKCYTILPQKGGWKLECQFTNITGFPPTHSANKVPLTGNKVRGHVSWGRVAEIPPYYHTNEFYWHTRKLKLVGKAAIDVACLSCT